MLEYLYLDVKVRSPAEVSGHLMKEEFMDTEFLETIFIEAVFMDTTFILEFKL